MKTCHQSFTMICKYPARLLATSGRVAVTDFVF